MQLVLVAGIMLSAVSSISGSPELGLTEQQISTFNQFKIKVKDKLANSEKYMKKDSYILRWLRARDFDINEAEQFLLENIKWREENNMSSIVTEDFSDLQEDYKVYMESVDKEGRPILFSSFGDGWDLRKGVVAGIMQKLYRYIDRNFELCAIKLADENVTQLTLVVNMLGYNVPQHGCMECYPFYIYITDSYEEHYPGYIHKIMLINTPSAFESVLKIIKPLMSPPTRDALEVYSQDKSQWEPTLSERISNDEIPQDLGGTKVYKNNL